jgi:acyl carrier protein
VNTAREQNKAALLRFLHSIQRAGLPVESLDEQQRLVASGLIDSLAILQIISYLENSHGIDFAACGVDPEQLGSIGGILDLIDDQKNEQ